MTVRFARWLRLVVAWASLLLGLTLVAVWVANWALSRTVDDTTDGNAIVTTLLVQGWVVIVLTAVVVLGLAVGAWLHRPLWARGVALVMAGMVLHWGWWLLDRKVDLFGMASMEVDDPGLIPRAEARLWVTLGVDVVAVLALLIGGVLLLRQRGAAVHAENERDHDPEPEAVESVATEHESRPV